MSGFKDLNIERMNVSFDFDSPENYTTFTSETIGPLQKVLANQTSERKKEILKVVTEATEKYTNKNTGIVSFVNEAILIVCQDPSILREVALVKSCQDMECWNL
jgi:hypothetical protein